MKIKNINARREIIDENADVLSEVLILYNEFWQEITRSESVDITENAVIEYEQLWFIAPPQADNEAMIYVTLSSLKDLVNNEK